VSNEGNRIAMQAAPVDDDDNVVTASTGSAPAEAALAFQTDPTPAPEFDDSLDAIEALAPGVPYVMGTFGGEPFALSDQPALAMFPSPDGQAVAWFEVSPDDAGALVLRIDQGGTVSTTPPFIPSSETALNYFPFFDQYELSHDFWSPSSRLFVYAGRAPGTRGDGIFTFDLDSGDITRIADGVVGSFTRTPQASGAASAL
jgi:hypothetical protein